MKYVLPILAIGLYSLNTFALAEEPEKEAGLLPKKVEKPIPDTYEPLNGADWNHRMSPEIQTLREYQEQEEEKAESEERAKLRSKLEQRIQEPGGGQTQAPAEPVIEDSGESMRIRDPE